MTRSEEKQQLRKTMRSIIRSLSPRYWSRASEAICHQLLAMPEYQEAHTVFCFVGRMAEELDTLPVIEAALQTGKQVCVPLCTGTGIMEPRLLTEVSQLTVGAYGIMEPPADAPLVPVDTIDFAIIPCLSCNRLGQRLGRGGGYYDRFLSHYRGGTLLLCPEKLLRDEIPVEPHDYPVPWVLTEQCLYEDGTPARLG